jgi:acyl-ACP thioesterase
MLQDNIYEHTASYPVRVYHCGADGRITLPALADFLQESASVHAEHLGYSRHRLLDEGRIWVLARLYVRMRHMPGFQDMLTLHTIARGRDKYHAFRDFELLDENGAEIGRATSSWLHMDIASRSMTPLDDSLMQAVPEGINPGLLDFPTRSVPRLRSPEHRRELRARRFDEDMNGHVNNARLVSWCLESVPDDYWTGSTPLGLDISFRSEGRRGEVVESVCAPHNGAQPDDKPDDGKENGEERRLLHSVRREGKDLCRAVSFWPAIS